MLMESLTADRISKRSGVRQQS